MSMIVGCHVLGSGCTMPTWITWLSHCCARTIRISCGSVAGSACMHCLWCSLYKVSRSSVRDLQFGMESCENGKDWVTEWEVCYVRSLHGCPLATCDRMSFWLSAHLETVRTHAVSDRLFRIM